MKLPGIHIGIALAAGLAIAGVNLRAAGASSLRTHTRGGVIILRPIPQAIGPFLYDPNHSLYEWELGDKPYNHPCYYDEFYGQWVGPCNISLDQPGYSITIPNRIRR